MRRGTTPILSFSTEFLASEINSGYITFRQKGKGIILEKEIPGEGVTVSDYEIVLNLTQEETLIFRSVYTDRAEVQIRLNVNDNEAVASNILVVSIKGIIKEGVI